MFYLIQKNVFRETNYNKIFETVQKLGLPYEEVEFGPDGLFTFETDRKDVFLFGSIRLAKQGTEKGWSPGSLLNDNHDYSVYSQHYKENLLNYDSVVQRVDEEIIWLPNELKFIRPTKDSKTFTGQLFSKGKWDDLVGNSLYGLNNVKLDTLIQVATPKTIYKEARTWIVNKKVVTSSYYRFGDNVEYMEDVEPEGLQFAQAMAELYQVADAFVLDICLTPDGWKIVEINCINMSGFYKGDLQRVVMALEDFYSPVETKETVADIMRRYSDRDLIQMTKDYWLHSIPEDSLLRKLAKEIKGKNDWKSILEISIDVGQELGRRLEKILDFETNSIMDSSTFSALFNQAAKGENILCTNISIRVEGRNTQITFDIADNDGLETGSYVELEGQMIVVALAGRWDCSNIESQLMNVVSDFMEKRRV